MIYPAYLHSGDKQQAHGVTLPDFAGCFTAADDYEDIPARVQEAIELHFEGEDFEIPTPSTISTLEASGEFTGGIWILLDVDVARLESKPMRLNVSLPTHMVKRMDDFAADNHLTRGAIDG